MGRRLLVDTIRGGALIAMILYHAAWFAQDARLVGWDLTTLPWVGFQRSIAATFFFLVGVSLHLATRRGLRWRPYLWRLFKILACAAVVTATSILLDPLRIVRFGILHSIGACSILALPARQLPTPILFGLAGLLIAAGAGVRSPSFDSPWLSWLGMAAHPPRTFDHQPLLPWLGVVLLGMAAGRVRYPAAGPLPEAEPGLPLLAAMGRHSLLIYMAHVPLLAALMAALRALLIR